MKKISYLFLLLAMAVCWGCKDEDSATLSLNADSLVFPYGGGTQTLTISSNTKWGISKLPEWISASVASGTGAAEVTLTAKANPEKTDRDGFAVIYSDDGQQTLVVGLKQLGTHSSPIILDNTEEKVFGGRESVSWISYEDAINITCDTEWDIEGPSWITIYYGAEEVALTAKLRLEGSGYIGLAVNETYTGDEARRDTIYFRTVSGESIAKVPVCQLGKNDIHCLYPVTCADGFVCYFKVGCNVEEIVPMLVEGDYNPSLLSYDDFNYWINATGNRISADNDGTYFTFFCLPWDGTMLKDKDFTLFMLGIDANNYYVPLENVCQYKFHSLNESELRPRVEITDVKYVNGHWQWTVIPNDYTSMYLTNCIPKSYIQQYGLQPVMMAFNMVWQYNYGTGEAIYSDISKTVSSGQTDDDIVIVAIPLGAGYKPSIMTMYDTNPSSANAPAKANVVFKHLTR